MSNEMQMRVLSYICISCDYLRRKKEERAEERGESEVSAASRIALFGFIDFGFAHLS
jgi:hypothetical protein